MIITDSSLNLASQHLAIKQYQKKQSLKVWFGAQRPDFEGAAKSGASAAAGDKVTLSGQQPASSTGGTTAVDQSNSGEVVDPKLSLLQSLIQTLTGRKVSIAELRKIVAPTTTTGSDGQAQATTGRTEREDRAGRSDQGQDVTLQRFHFPTGDERDDASRQVEDATNHSPDPQQTLRRHLHKLRQPPIRFGVAGRRKLEAIAERPKDRQEPDVEYYVEDGHHHQADGGAFDSSESLVIR